MKQPDATQEQLRLATLREKETRAEVRRLLRVNAALLAALEEMMASFANQGTVGHETVRRRRDAYRQGRAAVRQTT